VNFALSDEQLEFQQYCRKFASEVIRPVAPKYDREQSVPWDVIKESRKWKLSGLEYLESMSKDTEGLFNVIYAEELHWGCAGIALAISASGLAAAGIAASGTPEADRRVDPQVLWDRRRHQAGRLRRHGSRGRLGRQVAAHDREARR